MNVSATNPSPQQVETAPTTKHVTDDSDDANSETASGDPSTLDGANKQPMQLDFGKNVD